jgi:hypothetical protein
MAFYVFYSSYYHMENAIEASSEEDARSKLTVIEWIQGLHDPAAPWELVAVRSNPRPT